MESNTYRVESGTLTAYIKGHNARSVALRALADSTDELGTVLSVSCYGGGEPVWFLTAALLAEIEIAKRPINLTEHPNGLSFNETARYFQIGKSTLKRWVRQGRINPTKLGPRSVRFGLAEIHRMIAPPPPKRPAVQRGRPVKNRITNHLGI